MRVRRRFLHPIWLLLSLPGYLGLRLIPAIAHGPVAAATCTLLLIGACVLIPLSVRTRTLPSGTAADVLAWTGLIGLGFFSTLFVATVLRDCALLLARLVLPDRIEGWIEPSALLVLVVSALSCVIGLLMARRPRVVRVEVPIAGLAPALDGFSIAQLTDVHVGPTIRRGFVARVVARTNALGADLIAVTGDVVDGAVEALAHHTAPLADLRAPCGVYFVTGNHEYYSGEQAWTAEMRRLGLTALKNEHVVLHVQGAALVLAGVDDIGASRFDPLERSDPRAALRGAPPEASARILLAHQPSSAMAAQQAGFDLQISGHTHGGQFWPWNHFVRYFQPFTSGLNRQGNLWVYVSRGTGYWGPPNRCGVPSEITYIRLKSA